MKKLRIIQIAPVEEPVPPKKYGGTELVVANLIKGLLKNGHQVTLLASGDSATKARLVPIFKKSIRQDPQIGQDKQKRDAAKYLGAAKIVEYLQNNQFDLIHNHLGWRLLPFLPLLKAPVVTTLHGPLDVEYQQFVYGRFAQANYVSISNNQRRGLPSLNFQGTVYNGIETDRFVYNSRPGKYLAFLGRMSPEKGPVEAIRAAKKAGLPLVMAAKVDLVDREYYTKKVKPLIDGRQIKFIGEVGHAGKVKLLKDAIALLALIQWEEPFGLFMVEALACGTPVIATRRGSVPELIADKKTGFIVGNIAQAAAAVKKLDKISRSDCRQEAVGRFSVAAMTAGYEEVYRKILKTG